MKYIALVMILFSLTSKAQQISITGQIYDNKKEPVKLATIDIVGINANGTSDDRGVFLILLPASLKRGDVVILRVSKSGYQTYTKQVSVSYLSIPIELNKLKNSKKETTHASINQASLIQKEKPIVQIINQNQQGGMAGVFNLTVPEDKDLPIENNIIVKQITPTLIQFSPIQGTWKIPYVELLDSDNQTINPIWYWNKYGGTISISVSYTYWNRTIGNRGQEKFVRMITNGPSASRTVPYFLEFSKMPRVIIVGDQSDTSKIYVWETTKQ
ncbi:carboxypeptidase-like regulatory domain-containing protein [Mucilaginibacter celer]|uniref:Carboxypeptidase-like regulatory domain-containing protein n=1 Tax=Mucilaginibacter celer TaxID=2305508 RepID=A0A494VHH4_9SPHI|nr:carboxypeptidase-like regulatory domain-containing protein [Mucilaginibacter celer]AYL94156.1 hypothetical protein HYN43_002085 [Mucilaginibacter celer]